jgi:hypothetical protein
MRVALFSDVTTWIGEGEIPDQPSPPNEVLAPGILVAADGTVEHGSYVATYFSSLALQGVSSVPRMPAYVANSDLGGRPTCDVTNINIFAKPVSTKGA